jgi:hypothetical protein
VSTSTLRKRARAEGRGTDELLVLYVLERFLYRYRLSISRIVGDRHPEEVNITGRATLLAGAGRLRGRSRRHARHGRDRRGRAEGRCQRRRPGHPRTRRVEVTYPALLDEPFTMIGYPLETVLAEKLVTMIARGDTTTRDRDFADVWLLTGRHQIGLAPLREAITATAGHRDVTLVFLGDVLARLATDRQDTWRRFTARTGLDGEVPATLAEVIADVTAFVDPMLDTTLDTDASWGRPPVDGRRDGHRQTRCFR